jgi:2,3-dihydroxyethylbenzene 1,2-dioxygenase
MAEVIELGYISIGVSDLEAWRDYAAEVLAVEVTDGDSADELYLRMDYWHHRIHVMRDGTDDLRALGFRVRDFDALQEMRQQLKAAGIEFTEGTEEEAENRRVLELIKTVDPAGIPVEIFCSPLVEYARPFRPGRGMHGKFVTGKGGVGHAFIEGTYPESYDFYYLLGLRGGVEYKTPIEGIGTVKTYFMHCSDLQHTLAFGQKQHKRINHLMIEYSELDDVGVTHQVVQDRKIPVTVSLGKHSNDHNFSFYFKNPSDWAIECAWGGRKPPYASEYYGPDLYGHAFDPRDMIADLDELRERAGQ